MTNRITHHFTFGQNHNTTFKPSHARRFTRLADHWVEVSLPLDYPLSHRQVFIQEFTSKFCPHPAQWAFEYHPGTMKPFFFPGKCLCRITEEGIVSDG